MLLCDREIGGESPLFFILGPCVIESQVHALRCAEQIAEIAKRSGALVIYKSSFDKANRTSAESYRGPGIDEGLRILEDVRTQIGLPVLTDVHDVTQIESVAAVVDVIQTPALLARQTDFIQAVAASGKPVNIKKGQFLSPADMCSVAVKATAASRGQPIMLCERGTTFGYGNLVVDMRGLQSMTEMDYPVVFDATHSVQLPGALGSSSGGDRRFVPTLAAAAVATGIAGVFMETHPDPDNAPCDGPNAWPLADMAQLVAHLQRLDAIAKSPRMNH